MANGIDDFLKMFSSGATPDAEQAAEFQKRFVSTKPEDSQFDNDAYHDAVAEHLQKLPDDQFHDAAKVLNYARNEHPELVRQTVAEKPWFVKALGNPIVMGALTTAAMSLLSRRRST